MLGHAMLATKYRSAEIVSWKAYTFIKTMIQPSLKISLYPV